MKLLITPSRPRKSICAPPSKSFAHRALICAALSERECTVKLTSVSQDIEATLRAISAIGAKVEAADDGIQITPIANAPESTVIDCGESGSTLRFILPVCAALGIRARFICRGRLAVRPLGDLRRALEEHGISFDGDHAIEGQLTAGEFFLPGNVSSQHVTGLIFALSLLDGESKITLTSPLLSKPYVDITRAVCASFGITVSEGGGDFGSFTVKRAKNFVPPSEYPVEGDWSNAAFALAMSCRVSGLSPDSLQGDRAFCDILEKLGGRITFTDDTVAADTSALHAASFDAGDIPDIVPPIAVLCAVADGESRISGISRLRIKESDRVKSVCDLINSLGGNCTDCGEELVIRGVGSLAGGECSSHGDHRIAMSAALASCFCRNDVILCGAEAVSKSYPEFWEDFRRLGGSFREIS